MAQSSQQAPFNAGDVQQVERRKLDMGALQARASNGLKQVMANTDSRLWLYLMIEEAGPFTDPFTGNSQTFYSCGAQAWAKKLVAKLLDEHLDAYCKMMKENKGNANG